MQGTCICFYFHVNFNFCNDSGLESRIWSQTEGLYKKNKERIDLAVKDMEFRWRPTCNEQRTNHSRLSRTTLHQACCVSPTKTDEHQYVLEVEEKLHLDWTFQNGKE